LSKIEFSIVVPTFNRELKLFKTISAIKKSILAFKKKIKYEIIIINDGGKKINKKIKHIVRNIIIINLKKNKGVGFARNYGSKIAKFDKIYFVDSDIIIEENTLSFLYEKFRKIENAGSLGALQSYKNLNNSYSSKFVCAKSCYGFEDQPDLIEFSAIHSEICIVDKLFLEKIGGWKSFYRSGGEEFELGHRIIKNKKKNYLTKKTRYSTHYDNLSTRLYKIFYRTSNYLNILLERKKLESTGAFATNEQFVSTFLTLILILSLIISFYIKINFYVFIIIVLLIFLIEFKFLKFCKDLYSYKYIPFTILGIYLINIAIIVGFFYGIYNLTKKYYKKIFDVT
jgi:glycosyltransferase involved in cell wall biosynthesis